MDGKTMRILQICHKIPFPLKDGGALALYYSALGLVNQGADLKILAVNATRDPVDINCIPPDFRAKTRLECVEVDTRIKPLQAMVNLLSRRSYFAERFLSGKFMDALARILAREEFDIIQLEHVYLCLYLDTIREHSKAKVVLRPQNVENKVWGSYARNQVDPVAKTWLRIATRRLLRFEVQAAKNVDGIISISAADEKTFREYAPGTPLVTVPIGYDLSVISKYDGQKQFSRFPVFYHLGSMDWLPNREGIKWFIEEVIPEIRKEYSGFVLRIAGKKMPRWLYESNCPNLVVDGEVPDAGKYHEDKSILIVPVLSGGGLRAKIIEGMAFGKVIISTTRGAEGIPYTDGKNILIADTKEDFAQQVWKCRDSRELCMEIEKNAQQLARENYDYTRTGKSMMRFYEQLAEEPDLQPA
jgi:polysaccharide biosynthesis protein PslH